MKLLVSALIIFSLSAAAHGAGQHANSSPRTGSGPSPATERDPQSWGQDINLPDEMRARLAIARREDEHKKILEDAALLNDLSVEVATGYEDNGSLSQDEMKKLSTIEKLAKRILTHAGGKEVRQKRDDRKDGPIKSALDQLIGAAGTVKDHMVSDTRFVVSTTVVATTNEIIKLTQFLRRSSKTRPKK